MTYQEIRTELIAMKTEDRPCLARAKSLIGRLTSMGISPRRVRLSLRHLGLSPRQNIPR